MATTKPERALLLQVDGREIYLPREDWQALQRTFANLGSAHQLRTDLRAMLDTPLTECSECGGPLETHLRIDLDDVRLKAVEPRGPEDWRKYVIAGFRPAGSANFPESGIVNELARVTCVDCGAEVEGVDFTGLGDEWRYA